MGEAVGRPRSGPARRALVAVVVALLTASCSLDGYAFRVDESISFLAPQARRTVDLPVTVRWHDDEPPRAPAADPARPDARYYAVFVDRSPIGPGRDLASVTDDPARCRDTVGCPSARQLRDAGVIITAERQVVLEFLTDQRPSSKTSSKDPHEVTVVRMAGDERVGEAAFRLTFFVRRG